MEDVIRTEKQPIRIGVITFFNYCNFGAALQSYALCKVLQSQGNEVEYLDYTCSFIDNPLTLNSIKKRGLWGFIYTVAGKISYAPRQRLFREFRKQIPHTGSISRKNIHDYSDSYDLYISGSDQMWNTGLTDFDKTYFLDFVTDSKKKYSYSVSFGGKKIAKHNVPEVSRLISDFEKISVREEYGRRLVKKLTGKTATVLPDPTMLLTKEEWEKIAAPEKSKKEYILVYQMGFSKSLIQTVNVLKKKTGLPVYYIPFPLGGWVSGKYHLRMGPAEWLAAFRDASYIVTDSFHGAAFSVLFEKRFSVIVDGQHKNERAVNLLTHLGLLDRIVENGNLPDDSSIPDYAKIKEIIKKDKEEAENWLRKITEDCREIKANDN